MKTEEKGGTKKPFRMLRMEELEVVGPCDVFEKAAQRLREDLEQNPIDPWYSKDWGKLANQVVGMEESD